MSRKVWAWGLLSASCLGLALLATAQEKKPGDEPKKPGVPAQVEKPQKPDLGQPADKPGEKPGPGAQMEELMKKCAEYGTPGEGHKCLEPMVGKFEYATKWWLTPDGEAQESKGTCEYKWILDGRFLQQDVVGPPEPPENKPFKGLGLCGYDNMKKEYTCIWTDNMSTGMMVSYGKADAAGKVITYTGEGADPMTGNLHQKFRAIEKIESKDKHTFEYYSAGPDGKEFKMMEITYTRVK